MADRTTISQLRPILRATDTESSILMYDEWAGPKHAWQSPDVLSNIYWSLFYLSFVGIWAYQSLLSAQAYYTLQFPDAGLAFWGTVAVGSAMFITHCLQMVLNVDSHVSHSNRVVPALVGFVGVAVLVTVWRKAIIIIAGFALVGIFSSLSQSPLYGLAGLFPTGVFTQAMSAGNGLAGMLTVTVETIIRMVVVHTSLSREAAHFVSFVIFMSLLVLMGCFAVGVYLRLIRMPVVQLTIADASLAPSSAGSGGRSVLSVASFVWLPAMTEFLVLFVSLAVWPGMPCSAHTTGWFARHPDWFCAPAVIAAYNYADLIGRGVAGLGLCEDLPMPLGTLLALLRCLFIPIVSALSTSERHFATWLLLIVIFIVGLSNGLLSTIAMMQAPQMFENVLDRRTAAAVMTAAMFGGIAAGSILPAVLLRS